MCFCYPFSNCQKVLRNTWTFACSWLYPPQALSYRSNWNKHLSRLHRSQQGTANTEISLSWHNFSPRNSTVESCSKVHMHTHASIHRWGVPQHRILPQFHLPHHGVVTNRLWPNPSRFQLQLWSKGPNWCGLPQGHAHTGNKWSYPVPHNRWPGGNTGCLYGQLRGASSQSRALHDAEWAAVTLRGMDLRPAAAAQFSWEVMELHRVWKWSNVTRRSNSSPWHLPCHETVNLRLEQTCVSSFSLTAAHFWILAKHLSLPQEPRAIKPVTSLLQNSHLHE